MIIYIKPKSLFPTLHSDTIFGAIISAASQLYIEQLPELINKFKGDETAPFLISSAFPYLEKDGKKIRFYPKPLLEPAKTDINHAKIIKKVNYVQENIFKTWINPAKGEKTIVEQLENYHLQEGLLLDEDIEMDFEYQNSTIPRNSINRITNASENIFYSSGVSFRGIGLYFLVKFLNKDYQNLLKGSIKFLRDRGFGGDISIGKGHFDYEIINENPLPDEGDHFVTLSRYCPTSSELSSFDGDLWYEIGSKRGRSADGSQRKEFKFFREGSSFKRQDQHVHGRIVEVAPKALEYGLAYTVGVV